jgi:transposase
MRRHLYNWSLSERIDAYQQSGGSISYNTQQNQLPDLKKERPWYKPAHHTSQKCSVCGQIVKKALSVRTHRCPCGFVANRDHHAAINILRVGLDTLAV